MGLGPTAVIGYMNEDGNWTPVTSEKGLPVTGGGGSGDAILNRIATVEDRVDGVDQLLQSVSSQTQNNTDEIDTLQSTVAALEARLEALENPEEG